MKDRLMNNIELLQEILEKQNEIKYLGYLLIVDHRTGEVSLKMSASGISRDFKFKNINKCLNKIIDILQQLRRLETYYLRKQNLK